MIEPTNKDFETAQEGDGFYCESGYGVFEQAPYVQITIRLRDEVRITQITPQNARELAMNLLQCAEAADMDAMVIRFLQSRLHFPLDKAAQVIFDLRVFRDEMNGPEREAKK